MVDPEIEAVDVRQAKYFFRNKKQEWW